MGLRPGAAMGKMLAEAYDAQLNLEVRTRINALARAETILRGRGITAQTPRRGDN